MLEWWTKEYITTGLSQITDNQICGRALIAKKICDEVLALGWMVRKGNNGL